MITQTLRHLIGSEPYPGDYPLKSPPKEVTKELRWTDYGIGDDLSPILGGTYKSMEFSYPVSWVGYKYEIGEWRAFYICDVYTRHNNKLYLGMGIIKPATIFSNPWKTVNS